MPNTHATLVSLFTDIANAIRAKTGSSASIVADTFPTAISNIPTGSSGLEYETGTYNPSSNESHPTISFSNTHTVPPTFVLMADTTSSYTTTTNTCLAFCYFDWYRAWGQGISYSSSAKRYGAVTYIYRGTSASSTTISSTQLSYNSDNTGSSGASYPRYWVTPTNFRPYCNSTSRYWRSDRTYQWIAVWT